MKRRAAIVAAMAGVGAALYIVPESVPLCGFKWLTGRPCPLCGLTHAMIALAKGHWHEAIAFHALSPLAAAMLGALVWDRPIAGRIWLACGAAFGVYGLWRMFA
jgi:hypothetical protein